MELLNPCSVNSRKRPCALVAQSEIKIKNEKKRKHIKLPLNQRFPIRSGPTYNWAREYRLIAICCSVNKLFLNSASETKRLVGQRRKWRYGPSLSPLVHCKNQLAPIIEGPTLSSAKPYLFPNKLKKKRFSK